MSLNINETDDKLAGGQEAEIPSSYLSVDSTVPQRYYVKIGLTDEHLHEQLCPAHTTQPHLISYPLLFPASFRQLGYVQSTRPLKGFQTDKDRVSDGAASG